MTCVNEQHPALQETLARTRARLLEARHPRGFWPGRLSDSALSTATSCIALALVDRPRHSPLISGGLNWLAEHVNADGGWGDTVASPSNLNTTCLCWSAFACAPVANQAWDDAAEKGERWIERHVGSTRPDELAHAILKFYGEDRTFSTPIITVMALAGRLGPQRQAFAQIPPLPFELAAFPRGLWRLLRLPVVSYALPALVAIGQARHVHCPPVNPLLRIVRNLSKQRTLRVVARMQPGSGGFLEAIPLTSFVCACLASMGLSDHPIAREAVRFLLSQNRPNGSWPIDSCLSTWVTSLAVHALSVDGRLHECLCPADRRATVDFLLNQQCQRSHPFTNTPPGGWSWMEGDGAVPDADDTPAAMLAVASLAPHDERARRAIARAAQWLVELQNRDGGVPTFCRGWGKLPFDRSAADITAHAIRGWHSCLPMLGGTLARRVHLALVRAADFLRATQRGDGSWLPLWFGNQWGEDHSNPCYGTARVLKGLAECGMADRRETVHALRWLVETCCPDGGWSGGQCPPSIEETSVAVEALATWLKNTNNASRVTRAQTRAVMSRGVGWLVAGTDCGRRLTAAPIGLYFAKLWYHEDLYPLVFAHAALSAAAITNRQ